jgi:hypothetical protein
MRWIALPTLLLLAAVLAVPAQAQQLPVADPTVAAARDTTPVVVPGAQLGDWAAPSNQTVQPPLMDALDCPYTIDPGGFGDPTEGGADGITSGFVKNCPAGYDAHNHYADPALDTKDSMGKGVPVDRLLGFRWDAAGKRFVQIPFQVDEQFTRYLDNTASGFSVYSGRTSTRPTRTTARASATPRTARPTTRAARVRPRRPPPTRCRASTPTTRSPSWRPTPARRRRPTPGCRTASPARGRSASTTRPTPPPGRRSCTSRSPAGTAGAGLRRDQRLRPLERDANAGPLRLQPVELRRLRQRQVGPYCDANGNVVGEGRRRPRDGASITTKRYRFRYDGRWLMTKIEISPDGGRPTARPRRPLEGPGLRAGPRVRDAVLRLRGGGQQLGRLVDAARREGRPGPGDPRDVGRRLGHERHPPRDLLPRRDEAEDVAARARHPAAGRHLRAVGLQRGAGHEVHQLAGSHAVDGRNDEAYGNLDDPCNPNYDAANNPNGTSALDQGYRTFYQQLQLCRAPYHLSADLPDLTFGDPSAGPTGA